MKLQFAPNFQGYQKKHLKDDLLASLVVTAIAIPESLGFAAIVGLPLVTGLYCALLAPIVFAILTSSRRVIVGADSATATLVAAGGSLVAVAGTAAYQSAIVTLGLLTGVTLIVMAFSKFGFLANFISKPVLVGFFAGIGLQLIIGKIPELLGIEASGTAVEKLIHALGNLSQIHWATALLALSIILVIYLAERFRAPAMLIGLVFGTVIASWLHLGWVGIKFAPELPAGLPHFVMPDLNPYTIVTLIPIAVSIALVIIAQGASVSREMAAEHDEKINLDQDILAFGAANVASAVTQGFAINGSPPRSLAAEKARGRSQMVNIFMAILIGLTLLFATNLFAHIPQVALAVIVFMIGWHLIRFDKLKQIYKTRRTEFFIALVALIGVALLGVRQGVLIAVIVALMERLYRQYQPTDQILLRDGKMSEWARDRIHIDYQETRETKGLLIYRFNGSIFFDNAQYFLSRALDAVAGAKTPVTDVIVDAGAIDDIDYTAVENLRILYTKLKADDVQLGLAHVSPHLMKQLESFGVINILGGRHIYPTLNNALTTFYKHPRDVVTMVEALDLPRKQFVVIGGALLAVLELRQTHSADLVVSDELYEKLRDELGWREYAQDNGKCILSKEGFHAMHRWLGWNVATLQKDALEINGVQYIHPLKLIEGKKRLNRPKDIEDIKLLKRWLKKQGQQT